MIYCNRCGKMVISCDQKYLLFKMTGLTISKDLCPECHKIIQKRTKELFAELEEAGK